MMKSAAMVASTVILFAAGVTAGVVAEACIVIIRRLWSRK